MAAVDRRAGGEPGGRLIVALEERVRRVMSAALDMPVDAIDRDCSADALASWDSVAHLNLVIALEEEFQMSLDPEEIALLTNFAAIVASLRRHGAVD